MRVLHILRSRPNDLVRRMIAQGYGGEENLEVSLYEGPVDYRKLLSDLFASEQVISWW